MQLCKSPTVKLMNMNIINRYVTKKKEKEEDTFTTILDTNEKRIHYLISNQNK